MALLNREPVEAQAAGQSYLKSGIEDVVFGTIRFADGKIAHLHVSWLDPHKERKVTIIGSTKMAVFDDMSRDQKLKLYNKGVEKPKYESYGEYMDLRFGDVLIPRIPNDEPLKLECEHFVECLVKREPPISDGKSGLRVVRALDALQRSLDAGGRPVSLAAPAAVDTFEPGRPRNG
jgi:predicted dehydrogenase